MTHSVNTSLLADVTFLPQTRLSTGTTPNQRGNCYAAVIGTIMGLESAESAFQVQEYYDQDRVEDLLNWSNRLDQWLLENGYRRFIMSGHQANGIPYVVIGMSARKIAHACLYKNGKLLHDPHPDQTGLLTEELFELILPARDNEQN